MCEWIGFSPNIVALIREKNNLWKKNKQYMRDGRCNRLILDHLKDISRKLVHMKAMAKEKYYSAKFANCVSSKDTWKTIKEVISTGKRNDNDFVYLEEDGVPVNEATVADKFAEYFSTVGQNLADEIETGHNDGSSVLDSVVWNEHSIFLTPATENEILSLVISVQLKKAAGIDNIPASVIKNCSETIVPVLTTILNGCISNGIYPDALKTARVVPIFKAGSKKAIDNYRPISVLPVLNNIFERVIYNRLEEFINKHKILYDYQYGFRYGFRRIVGLALRLVKLSICCNAK